ncbi:hypothetical protein M422DRAFT_39571, partial [Sphaerobolus stellatus SS14]
MEVGNTIPRSSKPNSYWADAIEYAAYVRNVVPDVSRFRIFGCTAHVLIPESKRQKRCVDRTNGHIYESRDVVFDEGSQLPSERVTINTEPSSKDKVQVEVETDDDIPDLQELDDSDAEDDPFSDNEGEMPKLIPINDENPFDDPPPPPPDNSRPSRTRRAPVRDDDDRYSVTSY